MSRHSDRLAALLVGADRARTRRALVFAIVLLVATATLEYLLLRSGHESGVVETLHEAFLLAGYFPSSAGAGAAFVVGLAGLHAYLNEGYLPSVLLGWSPVFGNLSWTIDFPGIETYYLDPLAAFERTFPEAFVLATLGFVVGVGLRRIRKRWRSRAGSRPRTESGEIRSPR